MIPKTEILKDILDKMLLNNSIIDYRLLYSKSNNILRDIDVFFIVEDSIDYSWVIQEFSMLIIEYIRQSGVHVACFPISFSNFKQPSSQFLKNIVQDGVTL